jgi:hypothetical protein
MSLLIEPDPTRGQLDGVRAARGYARKAIAGLKKSLQAAVAIDTARAQTYLEVASVEVRRLLLRLLRWQGLR